VTGRASATLTFGGTATSLLRFGRFTVLTDPNFLHRGQWAYLGKGLASRRRTEPALGPGNLPPLDAVVLSHLHGDHFDRVARRGLTRQVPLLTTPSAARRLARHHFATVGMPTGTVETFRSGSETLEVESVPAIHARGFLRTLLPEVMGTVYTHRVDGRRETQVYVTGDTLTGDHVDVVARAFPHLDSVVAHLGGTRILGRTVTMDDVQGADLVRRVGVPLVVPIHHDDYGVFRSPLRDFLARSPELPGVEVRPVARGATVSLRVD